MSRYISYDFISDIQKPIKKGIIVREDLETDFVVRYINAENRIYEVV